MCAFAAEGGHLEVLKWAREYSFEWDVCSCSHAACDGHLVVMKWARETGCERNMPSCRCSWTSARTAHANGCELNADDLCIHAARSGNLALLQYVHSNGCNLTLYTFNAHESAVPAQPFACAPPGVLLLQLQNKLQRSSSTHREPGCVKVCTRAWLPCYERALRRVISCRRTRKLMCCKKSFYRSEKSGFDPKWGGLDLLLFLINAGPFQNETLHFYFFCFTADAAAGAVASYAPAAPAASFGAGNLAMYFSTSNFRLQPSKFMYLILPNTGRSLQPM